jgi:hypothetical protein
MNDSQLLMMALFSFFGLLITAMFISKPIAFSANTYFNKLDENNFPFFIMSQIIVPFIAGAIIMVIYFIPQLQITETYIWIGLALMIVISSILISKLDPLYFDEDQKEIKLSWPLIYISAFLLIILRVAFHNEILMNW